MDQIINLTGSICDTQTKRGVGRVKYEPYDMNVALSVVERIGKGLVSNFDLLPVRECYQELIKFIHADDSFNGDLSKGLMLMGPTGTGKTLAMEIMRVYRQIDDTKFIINGKLARMNFDVIPVNHIVSSFMANGYDGIEQYCTRYLICIDDLGSEVDQVKYYGNNCDVVGHVISERYARKMLTLATTNFPMEQLESKYNDRVISRMHSLFNFVELVGKDWRR